MSANFNDVLIFIAIFISVCLGIALLVLLVMAMVKLNKTMGKINKIIDDNTTSIGDTVAKLPQLTENIDIAVTGMNETLNGINKIFFGARSTNDVTTNVISVVESITNLALNFFSRKKR